MAYVVSSAALPIAACVGILTKLGLNNRVQFALLPHDAGLLDTDE
jgi:hypothetical protein